MKTEKLVDELVDSEEMEEDGRWEWLRLGIEKHWVSEVFCSTHDGPPYLEEDDEYENEYEEPPCVPCVRVWE